MNRTRTTDEQTWAILTAPDDMSAQQLADELGLTFSAVHHRRWHLRKHGWSCRVSWDLCPECGSAVMMPRRRYHPTCVSQHRTKLYASYFPDRYQRMTQEQLDARTAWRDAHDQRTQETTRAKATNHGQSYTEDEDDLIMTLAGTMTIERVALEVGRTRAAVKQRLNVLRRRDTE